MNGTVNTSASANAEQNNAGTDVQTLVKKEVINKIMLTGNTGGVPEMIEMTSGMQKAKFRVATNRYFKNKEGEWQSETTWHNVVAWGRLAIIAQKNLDKGTPVNIEGKINYRMYVDKDGVSRFYTEVVANQLVALPKKEKEAVSQKLAA
ncbi:MAG: single-stranded DNA-binding protein [Bacteroidia bacterium]|nr:single-stranded DNA-binding protein [Bacteroidia bacterium]